jgi:hypothetical protein
MAIKWPLANGVWSNAANWNDGTLPDVGDDVHADGKTVTIDQDIQVLSIRTTQREGGTAGGSFIADDGVVITSSISKSNSSTVLTYTGNVGITIIGDISSSVNFLLRAVLINQGVNAVTNILGNISSSATTNSVCVDLNGGIFNITGNVRGSTATNSDCIRATSCTINIIGNLLMDFPFSTISSSSGAINANTSVNIFLTGNVSSLDPLVNATIVAGVVNGFGYMNVVGNLFSSNQLVAVNSTSFLSTLIFKGNLISSSNGVNPIYCPRVFKDPSPNTYFEFADSSTNGQIGAGSTFLYSADTIIDAPQPSDVRKDVVYADGILTGTLAVPDPSNVRKDIPTDNTVGTADLTAEDILNAIQSSENPVAERLRNVSTVQTTGSQLQAYLDQ